MKAFLKVAISIICALYPVLVFIMLVIYKLPVRIISLCVIFLGLVYFISSTNTISNKNSKNKFDKKSIFSSLFFLVAGVICYFTNNNLFLKFYPVVVSLTLLFVFSLSLFNKTNIIFRFACLQDKSIKTSYNKKRIEK